MKFLSLALVMLSADTILSAHHSFAAEFDGSKPIVLHGKITKISWMNPHVFFWMDVADSSGKVTNWTIESVAPNYLLRLGWTKQSLKTGDTVTVRAFPAKDQANLAKTDEVTLPDGRIVTTGRRDDTARESESR